VVITHSERSGNGRRSFRSALCASSTESGGFDRLVSVASPSSGGRCPAPSGHEPRTPRHAEQTAVGVSCKQSCPQSLVAR
jgi:hypothetical protein